MHHAGSEVTAGACSKTSLPQPALTLDSGAATAEVATHQVLHLAAHPNMGDEAAEKQGTVVHVPDADVSVDAAMDTDAVVKTSCAMECQEVVGEAREDSGPETPQGAFGATDTILGSLDVAEVLRRYREESSACFQAEPKSASFSAWSPRMQLAHASSSTRLQPCPQRLRCDGSTCLGPRIAQSQPQLAGMQCELWSCSCPKVLVEAAAQQAAQLLDASNGRVIVLMTTQRLMLWYALGTSILEKHGSGSIRLLSHEQRPSAIPPDHTGLYLALERRSRLDGKSRQSSKSSKELPQVKAGLDGTTRRRGRRMVDDDDSSNERVDAPAYRGRKPSGACLRQRTWSLVILDTLRCNASKVVQTAAVMAARESLGSVPERWLVLNHAKADERMGGA